MTAISRRAAFHLILTTFAAAGVSAGLVGIPTSAVRGQSAVTPEVTVEQWMSEWMTATRPVSGALHMSRFKDPIYFLTKPIQWMPNKEQDLPLVKVPKGFVTDLASIPRVFWSLLRPDGEYTYPAIIHDYLYWTQNIPKEKADLIFRLAMEDFNVNAATALIIYNAVSTGGGSAWRSNTDQRAHGEMRFLKRFPEDPTVTWAEWKKEPDVFDVDLR
jgi:hypothetical protein